MIETLFLILLAQLQPASVQGIVLSANTRTPLANARVELLRTDGAPPQSYPAITAADGTFRIPNVRPGAYRLSAAHNGYLPGEYGQRRPGGASSVISLGPGQAVRDIQLAIVPAGVISGRVYDGEGDPSGAATVFALKPAYQDGRRVLEVTQSAITNDLGEYRLFGLTPGQYYVSATPNDHDSIRSVIVNPARTPTAVPGGFRFGPDASDYLPVYFPGVSDVRLAAPIDLDLGADRGGLDIVARPVRMYRARGTIAAEQGNIKVVPLTATPGTIAFSAHAGPDGRFDFGGLVPGTYLLEATFGNSKGRTVIEVSGRDVENISIPFSDEFRIPGRLTFDDRPPSDNEPDAERIFFQLVSDPALDGLEADKYSPFANGSFRLGVYAGNYRITLLRFPGNAYLKSIRLGDQDVLNDGLQVRGPADGRIEIVIGTKPGSLSGAAMNERRQPVPNASIVLIPDAGRRRWPDTVQVATADASGRFQIPRIPPGSYTLFAWDDLEPNAWQDPSFMRAYEGRGTPIRIAEGSPQTVEVAVLPEKMR